MQVPSYILWPWRWLTCRETKNSKTVYTRGVTHGVTHGITHVLCEDFLLGKTTLSSQRPSVRHKAWFAPAPGVRSRLGGFLLNEHAVVCLSSPW